MKIIALILSQVLFLNEGFSRSLSTATFRLEFEKKLLESVEQWNKAKNYNQLIDKMPATKAEKALLKNLVQEEGLSRTKPVPVDFVPREHKFKVHLKSGVESIWVLSMDPTFVAYDGKQVLEFRPKSNISDYFSISKTEKKSSKLKSKSAFWKLILPEAQAQFLTPEKQIELEARYKKEADRQTKLVKKILLVTLLSFVGFLAVFWAWGKFAHHLNPNWGVEGAAKKREEKDLARENFPDVEKTLFSTDESLEYFSCESEEKSSALRLIRFKGKDESKLEFNFGEGTLNLESLLKANDPHSAKLEKAEYCCQHHPCGVWLAQRLTGEVPAIYESETHKSSGTR